MGAPRRLTADLVLEIEPVFKCTQDSVNAIAKRFDVSEPTLRRYIKKHGWIKAAPETKRRIVADHFAGVTKGVTDDEVRQSQDSAAAEDILDMGLGLKGARLALQSTVDMLEGGVSDARDIKTLSECIRTNVETIRMIRGLDEPTGNISMTVLTGVPDAG